MHKSQLAVPLFFFLTIGCTKEKRDPASASIVGSAGTPTLSSLQSDVFALSCATSGCHDNRATPAASLDMTNTARSYAGLVNRFSTQVSTLKIVNPGNPSNSYLVNKLVGTHIAVGGSGSRMPQYASALSSSDLDRILNWITDGAQNN